ncbi:MAG: hypothetical protein RI957_486 [Verrucomicrobiota bacterium]|jgi:hypothetical protein
MKIKTALTIASLATTVPLCAQGLYYVGQEATESIPLTWTVGATMVWDNNVTPLIPSTQLGHEDSVWSITPFVEANYTLIDPKTNINLYARAGVNYYLDGIEAPAADDTIPNLRAGFDFNHSVSPRLRFSSRNFIAYEMEPQFAVGISNDRTTDPYFLLSTDNSVGYRWTQRVGSYTGIGFTGFFGETEFADRKSWNLYHQMRYQYNPRTVLTGQYRYAVWTGDASDTTNHFITGGIEHRLSQTAIFLASAGVQLRSVDSAQAQDSTSPFLEGSMRSQINSAFGVRGFFRYSMEDFNTIQNIDGVTYEYSELQVFRVGLTGDYRLSPRLTGFGGLDVVHTMFDGGNKLDEAAVGPDTNSGRTEDLINGYIGLRAQLNEAFTLDCSINYTDSISDSDNNDYNRLRLSTGLNYTF